MSRPLPKSLHTVTVIVNVASFMLRESDTKGAIRTALHLLGYSWDHDPYGLADAAKRALDIAAARPAKDFDL